MLSCAAEHRSPPTRACRVSTTWCYRREKAQKCDTTIGYKIEREIAAISIMSRQVEQVSLQCFLQRKKVMINYKLYFKHYEKRSGVLARVQTHDRLLERWQVGQIIRRPWFIILKYNVNTVQMGYIFLNDPISLCII